MREVTLIRWKRLVIGCVLGLLALAATAQDKVVTQSTFTGGGGQSSGSRFAVIGSIGQVDATVTRLAGSRFAVTGGIHARVFIVQTPGAPRLELVLSHGSITLSWPEGESGYVLEESPAIGADAVWTIVSGVTGNQWTGAPPAGNRFYRLRKSSPN